LLCLFVHSRAAARDYYQEDNYQNILRALKGNCSRWAPHTCATIRYQDWMLHIKLLHDEMRETDHPNVWIEYYNEAALDAVVDHNENIARTPNYFFFLSPDGNIQKATLRTLPYSPPDIELSSQEATELFAPFKELFNFLNPSKIESSGHTVWDLSEVTFDPGADPTAPDRSLDALQALRSHCSRQFFPFNYDSCASITQGDTHITINLMHGPGKEGSNPTWHIRTRSASDPNGKAIYDFYMTQDGTLQEAFVTPPHAPKATPLPVTPDIRERFSPIKALLETLDPSQIKDDGKTHWILPPQP